MNSDPKSALGTLAYTAPEALMNNFFDGSCSDVWCCGVMLYFMVTGAFEIPACPQNDLLSMLEDLCVNQQE